MVLAVSGLSIMRAGIDCGQTHLLGLDPEQTTLLEPL